jgi:multiple sugar transport system substrate-binding protein
MDVLFYHIEMLQSAGFDRPPKNRDEFLQIARKAANPARGRYGLSLALSPENPWGIYGEFLPWFWAAGAPLLQDGQARFDTPQGVDTLTFLTALRREGLIAPGSFTKTAQEKVEEFIGGQAAMMIGSISDIPAVRERGVPFGITTVPGPASYIGKPVFGLRGWYGGVSRAGKYKNEAKAFLNFLVKNRSRIGASARAVPGGRTAEDYISGDPLYSKAYDIYEAGDALEEFAGIPAERIEAVFREELHRMFEEGQTPASTAEAIRRRLATMNNEE